MISEPSVPPEEADVLVIGAGPSGSTAAISLCRPGLSIRRLIVADRATFPRDKPCGDGIGPGAVAVATSLGIEDIFQGFVPVTDVSVYGPRNIHFRSSLPLIDDQSLAGFVIPRITFDSRLLREAELRGADVREGWRLEALDRTADEHWLARFSSESGPRAVRAKLVVGADGANSRVRHHLKIPSNSDRQTGIAIRSYAVGQFKDTADALLFEW